MLPVLMMLPEPWRIIAGAAYFMPSTTPRRWVAMTVSKCSMSISAMPARRPGLPALLKRQSRRPNLASACSISDLTSGSLVTSVRTKAAVVPSFFANPSPSACRRPVNTTLAPSCTNSSAVRAPMPLVAPVMIATLPSSMPMALPLENSFPAHTKAGLISRANVAACAGPTCTRRGSAWAEAKAGGERFGQLARHLHRRLHSDDIAVGAEAADHPFGHTGELGMAVMLVARVNVGDVHLDERTRKGLDRIE